MFPELRPYLEDVFDEAEPGTEYVITRYRQPNANLRTQLLRVIKKAGITPWPKLFQNLRATRETELTEHFPIHVVTAWLGNSTTIAAKHYLQVTDEHFQRAAESAAVSPDNRLICPDLEVVIAAWPTLPEAVKAGILAMVETTAGAKQRRGTS